MKRSRGQAEVTVKRLTAFEMPAEVRDILPRGNDPVGGVKFDEGNSVGSHLDQKGS